MNAEKAIDRVKQDDEDIVISSDVGSDVSDSSDDDGERMEKYKKERMKTDMARKLMLQNLSIPQIKKEVSLDVNIYKKKQAKRKSSTARQFLRKTRKRSPSLRRKSLRILNQEPVVNYNSVKVQQQYEKLVEAAIPKEEFAMSPIGFEKDGSNEDEEEHEEEDKKAYKDLNVFLNHLTSVGDDRENDDVDERSADVMEYQKSFQSLKLNSEHIQKVTNTRITSMAVHPSSSSVLLAVGDKFGYLGLWSPFMKDSNNGTYLFKPHSSPISALKYSPINSNKLYMCSYDGTLRSLDQEKTVFEECAISEEGACFTSFDFMDSGHSIIVSRRDGGVSIYDSRVSRNESVTTAGSISPLAKCVSCHPQKTNFFLTSHVNGSVLFYDTRAGTKKNGTMKPLVSLKWHSKSVNSAYFSPITGNRVLTTCLDNFLRVFRTETISQSSIKLLSKGAHDNQTGRWLTPFKATWHPDSDDVFVVGSMKRPRQIDIYDHHMKVVHTLQDPEELATVQCVNCFHKKNYLFAGNASGKVHMFTNL